MPSTPQLLMVITRRCSSNPLPLAFNLHQGCGAAEVEHRPLCPFSTMDGDPQEPGRQEVLATPGGIRPPAVQTDTSSI